MFSCQKRKSYQFIYLELLKNSEEIIRVYLTVVVNLYVSVSLLLIFLFWNDDYILSTEGVTFRRVIFYKKHKWSEFPYCGVCYDNYKYSIDKNEKLLYFSKKPESDRKFDFRKAGILFSNQKGLLKKQES